MLQRFHGRQGLALDEFQERTAAGGNVGNLVSDAVLVDSRQRVAAAGDGEAGAVGDGLGQGLGAFAELVEFEDADRTVPEDGLGGLDEVGETGGGQRADVEDHVVILHFLQGLDGGGRIGGKGLGDHHVFRQRYADAAGDFLGGFDHVGFVQRLADLVTGGGEEGIGNAAADNQLVA
jgi:hypothetical protein